MISEKRGKLSFNAFSQLEDRGHVNAKRTYSEILYFLSNDYTMRFSG